jgi:hypothetical protein
MTDPGVASGDFVTVVPCCGTINNRGDMVAFSCGLAGCRALIRQESGWVDLNSLVEPGTSMYLCERGLHQRSWTNRRFRIHGGRTASRISCDAFAPRLSSPYCGRCVMQRPDHWPYTSYGQKRNFTPLAVKCCDLLQDLRTLFIDTTNQKRLIPRDIAQK